MGIRSCGLAVGVLCTTAILVASSHAVPLAIEAGLVASATAAIIASIRRHHPPRPDAWWLMLAAPWAVLLAAVAVEVALAVDAPAVAVESMVLLELTGYTLLAVGIRRLVSRSAPPRRDVVDAGVMLAAIGVLGWGLISPELPHGGLTGTIERVGDVGRLVLAALCLALALGVAASVGRRGRPAARWLVASAGMLAAVELLLPFIQRVSDVSGLDDVGLLIALLLLATAAAHPAMAALTPADAGGQTGVRTRVVALLVALAAPPLVLLADRVSGGTVQADALLVAWGLVTVVVMHRVLILTREREEVVREVLRQARYDDLTGVYNRRGLSERLGLVFESADRTGRDVALIYLDLDAFKPVNDRYGHVVGDLVLQAVAARLVDVVSPDDIVARLGGDEFVVVLGAVPSRAALFDVDCRLREAVEQPIDAAGRAVCVGVSTGLDLRPPYGHSPLRSLARADQAMYASKHDPAKAAAKAATTSITDIDAQLVVVEDRTDLAL